MRVGVLGGTFDPVHIGHLVLAEQARAALALDSVLFMPAGEPWRKNSRAITPGPQRREMLLLAIAGNDTFGISDLELRREGPTYTADTLDALAAERLDDEFWFVVGADALADLPNWHEPERIVRHATLAVAPRDAEEPLATSVTGVEARIERFSMPRIDVSSTAIRARVAGRRSIRYLVPDAVREYIERNALYTG
ncbi:MAG: nicotinate-nucleotide adenylyltransferase [Dehalococcoidia bacterium]